MLGLPREEAIYSFHNGLLGLMGLGYSASSKYDARFIHVVDTRGAKHELSNGRVLHDRNTRTEIEREVEEEEVVSMEGGWKKG